MNPVASAPVLPFAELLDELRRHGFVIGLDQHLRLQRLLDHLADCCPPERLNTHLCPIFATSREEQERFQRIFDRLYPAFASAEGGIERIAGEPQESLVPPRVTPSNSWIPVAAAAVIALALVVMAIVWRPSGRVSPPPAIDSVPVQPGPTPLPSPATDSMPLPPAEPAIELVAPDSVPPPGSASPSEFLARHRTGAQILVVGLPLLLFLLNEWRLYRRRRLVVTRQRREKPPFTWPVRIEAPINPFADSAELPEAARFLRQREAGEIERLSVQESISATIAALGFPTFRYRADTRPPEYLVLIERAAYRDHRARLFQSLGGALDREGVHTTRYLHDGDPRVCYAEETDQRELLTDLRRRFPEHRLLLFGSGERLVDPVSGRLHPWTTQLLSWSDRAILTPESPASWGLRELALAQHLVVLPATTAGLTGVVSHFDGPTRPDARRWQEPDAGPAIPGTDSDDPLPALRRYLGPRVYRWLCACAVYPELHWDLTLHFGGLPIFGPGLITEEHLLRLLRLPWFRQGVIPDEIRARLIDELTEAEERAVREAIVELLEGNPAPGDSVSANRHELDLVVQRLALNRRDPKERAATLRELAGFPRRDLVQDFAMLKLLEETPSSRLAVLLPRRLRRVFYRDGVPAFGIRAGVRVAVLVGVIAVGMGLTGRAPRPAPGWTLLIVPALVSGPVTSNVWEDLGSPDELRLIAGEQTMLQAWGPPEPTGNGFTLRTPLVTWRGEPAAVVTVDAEGLLTAIAPGRGTAVARTQEGDEARLPLRVLPTEFAIDRDSLLLSPGDLRSLKVIIPTLDRRELATRTLRTFEWAVRDSSVIRLASPAVVEALVPGRTTVTVRGLGHEASIAISVGQGKDEFQQLLTRHQEARGRALSAGASQRELAVGDQLRQTAERLSAREEWSLAFGSLNDGIQAFGTAEQAARARAGVDERPAVELVLREYARALTAGDLEAMLAVFPGMPAQMRNGYKEMFRRKWVLDTSRWRYLDISVKNGTAEARLGGSSVVLDDKGKPREESPFPRTASLRRDQTRWRIVAFDESGIASLYGPAVSDTASAPTSPIAGLAELRRLDSLRIRATAGRTAARKEYFAAFDSVLLRPTQELIRGQLRAGPDANTDYARSYSLLKAHLIITGYPIKSSPEVAEVLTRVWSEAARPSGYLSHLARAQFTYYASELQRDNSLVRGTADSSTIQRMRAFLQQFRSGEQIYLIMQMEAARAGARPFDFGRVYPNASQVLSAPYVVPGAFTRQGWRYMQDSALKRPDRYFKGEAWVLGGELSERKRYAIVDSIRSRYRLDYADQWRRVLAEARVPPFRGIADAARKVKVLSSNPSPLMQLINAVSLNTAMDSGFAVTVFQPALVVSPPDSSRLIGERTAPYMKALQALGTALEALAAAEPAERDRPLQEVKNQVAAAKNAASGIQLAFAAVPNGVGPDVSRLLQTGLSSIDAMLGNVGPAVVDQPRAPVAASLRLNARVTSLAIGETTVWRAVVLDAEGRELADPSLVWRSSAAEIAAVSGEGRITALTAGIAEITVQVVGVGQGPLPGPVTYSSSQRVTVTPAAAPPAPSPVSVPGEAVASFNRGRELEDQNALAKAREAYRDALRISPEYPEALAGLTRVVIGQRVQDWAKHIERRSITGLLQMYPEMPERDQAAWRRLLDNPSVTSLSAVPEDVTVELADKGSATVRYAIVYTVDSRPGGRQVSVSRYQTTFAFTRGAWLITGMRGLP